MEKTRETDLNISINDLTIRKILDYGRTHDLQKNGLYDGRSGCINIWCSPEDKPECWVEPTKGSLIYPRDFVGTLFWQAQGTLYTLKVDISPYHLLESSRSVSDDELDECLNWVLEKVRHLLNECGIVGG